MSYVNEHGLARSWSHVSSLATVLHGMRTCVVIQMQAQAYLTIRGRWYGDFLPLSVIIDVYIVKVMYGLSLFFRQCSIRTLGKACDGP